MKHILFIAHLLLAFTGMLGALETLAYRFVGEPVCGKPLAQYPALERAPAPTPFAAEGDSLRDLTPSIRADKVPLKDGWVLWNATRHLLVIRGAMTDQWRISTRLGFYWQPLNCQVNVEWLRTADANHPPAENDSPFASAAVLTPSGRKGNASAKITGPDGEWKFTLEAEVNDTGYGVLNVRLVAEDALSGDPDGMGTGNVNCCIFMLDGQPEIVASWYAAGRGDAWWLRVTATCLLGNGSPWSDARLRQTGGTSVPWPTATPEDYKGTVPECDGGFVGTVMLPDEFAKYLRNGEIVDLGSDPFAENGVADKPSVVPDVAPEAEIPDWLSAIAAPPLTDLSQLAKKHGPDQLEGCMVALEPESSRVVFAAKNKVSFGSACAFFYGMDDTRFFTRNNEYESRLVAADDPETILARVAVTSVTGTKCVVSRIAGKDEKPIVLLESELYGNEDSSKITADTASSFDVRTANGTVFAWKDRSRTELPEGIPLRTDALRLPDGRRIQRSQTARVISLMDP